VVGDLLDQVAATGLAHCLQARPGATGQLERLAAGRGMQADEPVPLMVLQGACAGGDIPTGLRIRELAPAEALVHAELVALGFGAPVEPLAQLMTPEVLAMPSLRCYVGEVDGRPVTTGLGMTTGTGVFVGSIATPPDYRRRGYGAAITRRAVDDGLASGATWSFLQSSSAGYEVYRSLGFRALESWACWLS
jgi:GNAT superfamily N-acetyltransferase